MYGAYLINEYHQDIKSIANFKVLKRMINVMMCYRGTFNVKFPKINFNHSISEWLFSEVITFLRYMSI